MTSPQRPSIAGVPALLGSRRKRRVPANTFTATALALFCGLCIGLPSNIGKTGYIDPLLEAATPLSGALRPDREPLVAITTVANRTLAVGLRGLAIRSDDNGRSWQQSVVPVQTDLVSVQLLNEHDAWATGHDGVILHSTDGGSSWQKQFDHVAARDSLQKFYLDRVRSGESGMQRYADELKLNTEGDVSLPFLGVWFTDEMNGFAVGSFGMIVATHDGGKSWLPWLHQIDNPDFLNLNAIRGIGGEVYITGEKGFVYKLDRETGRFVSSSTGCRGTLFDIVGTAQFLVAFGLRGAAYRSVDGGASWTQISTGTEASITAGAVLDDGKSVVLVSDTGLALRSEDEGLSFHRVELTHRIPVYGATETAKGTLALVGYLGVDTAGLRPAQATNQ